jgi:hypothetical protein
MSDRAATISEGMIAAGIVAFAEWRERNERGAGLTKAELVSAIYDAMLRRK